MLTQLFEQLLNIFKIFIGQNYFVTLERFLISSFLRVTRGQMESWIEKTNASEDEKEDLTKDDYNPRAAFGRRGL